MTTPKDEKKSITKQNVAAISLCAILNRFGYFFIFRFPPSDSSMPRACMQKHDPGDRYCHQIFPFREYRKRECIRQTGGVKCTMLAMPLLARLPFRTIIPHGHTVLQTVSLPHSATLATTIHELRSPSIFVRKAPEFGWKLRCVRVTWDLWAQPSTSLRFASKVNKRQRYDSS